MVSVGYCKIRQKLIRGGGGGGGGDRTKLELGWNRPRQYQSGVSEDLGGVK